MAYNNWNIDKIVSLRKNVSRYYRNQESQVYTGEIGEYFIEIGLAVPAKYNDTDETLTMRKLSSRIVTLQSTAQGDNLQYVADEHNPAFTMTMYHYGNSTFTNNTFRLANQRTVERKDIFTVYVDTQEDETQGGNVEVVKIVGLDNAETENLNLFAIANMVKLHMTRALKDDSAKQWTTKDSRKVAK